MTSDGRQVDPRREVLAVVLQDHPVDTLARERTPVLPQPLLGVEPREEPPPGLQPIVELLRVLLKMKCDENNVAAKLVASSADLEALAADDRAEIPAMQGWRRELFGNDALALKHGKIGLAVIDRRVRIVPAGEPRHTTDSPESET